MTAVGAGSIALALAGVVAVFAVANSVLWRPMALVPEPDRLVRMFHGETSGVWSYPHFETATSQSRTLQAAAAYSDSPIVVAAPDATPRTMLGVSASANIFDVLGVAPLFGRPFTDDDDDGVVLVGHGFWMRELGGRADVIGETLIVGARQASIIGVMPAGLHAVSVPIEAAVWYPIERELRSRAGRSWLDIIGRLNPEVTVTQSQAEFDAVAGAMDEDPLFRGRTGDTRPIRVYSEVDARVPGNDRAEVMAGIGGVLLLIGLVLTVACANVGNMTLARVSARRTEIAVRLAIGASRQRIISLIVAESVVLAALAGLLALVFTVVLFRWIEVQAAVLGIPPGLQISIDGRVLAVASMTALATTLVFGLLPAAQASRTNVQTSLQSGQPTSAGGQNRVRRLFVAAQVAGAVAFAVLAVLFMRSVSAVHEVDLGFDPDPVAVVAIDAGRQTEAADKLTQLRNRLTDQLSAEPGIDAFAFASAVPMSGFSMRVGLSAIEGYTPADDGPILMSTLLVSPDYFSVIGMPLLAGRDFSSRDTEGAPPVAIINQAFADRYWPDGSALGKRVGDQEVVGIVANAKLQSLARAPAPFLFQPITQMQSPRLVIHARTQGSPVQLAQRMQAVVRTMDSLMITEAQSMSEAMTGAFTTPTILSWAFSGAGLLSTLLATVGLYSVMSYLVGLRRREFGVRTALGATPTAITSMVLREGIGLVSMGLVAGVLLAAAIAVVLKSELVGVAPLDPVAILISAALIIVSATGASVVPARRAARVDPISALRN